MFYNVNTNISTFCFSTMSEMKDTNAVGNSEPMDQTGDNSMPSAQQQVIFCTNSEIWSFGRQSCDLVFWLIERQGWYL